MFEEAAELTISRPHNVRQSDVHVNFVKACLLSSTLKKFSLGISFYFTLIILDAL